MSSRSIAGVFERLVGHLTRHFRYLGTYEFRITSQNGNTLELQPVDTKIGLSDLQRVPMRAGVPGANGKPQPGAFCLVQFVNGIKDRAYVVAFVGADDGAFVPLETSLDASAKTSVGTSSVRTHVGTIEASNPSTSGGRFLRVGDIITNSGSSGPMPIVLDGTNTTMSTAGT